MFSGRILIIIQRSNGDVLLSSSLIEQLKIHLNPLFIDLLVNSDTLNIAKTLPHIRQIHTFSYKKKKQQRWKQEKNIIQKIYRKYDLSINLTGSDRSVFYALCASKNSISAIEDNKKKSWWKSLFLKHSYIFDEKKHTLLNNLEPLNYLGISFSKKQTSPKINKLEEDKVKAKLKNLKIDRFIIFHPSAQYDYKVYSETLRNELLVLLNQLNIPIIVTGTNSPIDLAIKKTLPVFDNVFDWINQTSIGEYIALSNLSKCYIGMDTLNMHIAASQNKPIFAIFGPTLLRRWSPWSNELELSAFENKPMQRYGNITIFQANLSCVACGKAGCNDDNGKSECLSKINPKLIFNEIKKWFHDV